MTKEESAKARAIMEAWENGKELQFQSKREPLGWCDFPDVPSVRFMFDDCQYRIKPESPKPIEAYVWVYKSPYGTRVREQGYFERASDSELEKAGWTKRFFREVI